MAKRKSKTKPRAKAKNAESGYAVIRVMNPAGPVDGDASTCTTGCRIANPSSMPEDMQQQLADRLARGEHSRQSEPAQAPQSEPGRESNPNSGTNPCGPNFLGDIPDDLFYGMVKMMSRRYEVTTEHIAMELGFKAPLSKLGRSCLEHRLFDAGLARTPNRREWYVPEMVWNREPNPSQAERWISVPVAPTKTGAPQLVGVVRGVPRDEAIRIVAEQVDADDWIDIGLTRNHETKKAALAHAKDISPRLQLISDRLARGES